jgi:hypothetical protein
MLKAFCAKYRRAETSKGMNVFSVLLQPICVSASWLVDYFGSIPPQLQSFIYPSNLLVTHQSAIATRSDLPG